MSGFFKCIIYLAAVGLASFFLGRILPKSWFRSDRFPYRAFPFEQNGNFYEKFAIRKWKDIVPDMSRILPKLMPSRKISPAMTANQVRRMLQETCVAEFIHTLLCAAGLACIPLWKGAGGRIFCVIYILGNIPFNLIQRYNRPKLARILERLNARENVHSNRQDR